MPGAFLEDDIATMLADDEFATVVTLGGVEKRVIWDNAYVDQLGTASRNPIVQLQTSQIGALVVGTTTLVKGGVTYKVIDHQPDGTGMSLLELQKAA